VEVFDFLIGLNDIAEFVSMDPGVEGNIKM
jgi:hypothetical protein